MNRQEVFDWIGQEYGVVPDYPWEDDNAVFRHRKNRKWFALVMNVGREKLGLPEGGAVAVMNVKCHPLLIGSLRSQPGFHPAYHMNKEQWLSVRLDGSASDEDIKALLAISHALTAPKKGVK